MHSGNHFPNYLKFKNQVPPLLNVILYFNHAVIFAIAATLGTIAVKNYTNIKGVF